VDFLINYRAACKNLGGKSIPVPDTWVAYVNWRRQFYKGEHLLAGEISQDCGCLSNFSSACISE
jgi:hypothetical protein